MVIAFVSTIRSSWGGSEELWYACAMAAVKHHTVIISAYDCGEISGKTNSLLKQGAILDIRPGAIAKNIPVWAQISKRVKRVYTKKLGNPFSALFKYKPDIVLYIGTAYSIGDDYKLIKLIKKNTAQFFINVQLNDEYNAPGPSAKQKERISEAYTIAKKVAFVSERNKKVAETVLGGAFNNALVVRNPVNLYSTEVMPFPDGDTVQFGMVGNLRVIHKGQDIALEVLSSETWKHRNWHLNLYGSGEDERYLKKLVDSFGLKNRITFHGRVSNIRDVWAANHVLLMPSHMEGMPLAVVEAMVCGRPAIVTDVGGNAEWIDEGREGFIAGQPTVRSFAEAAERAWAAKDNWAAIGKNAHEKAMRLYDQNTGKTLLRLLTGE